MKNYYASTVKLIIWLLWIVFALKMAGFDSVINATVWTKNKQRVAVAELISIDVAGCLKTMPFSSERTKYDVLCLGNTAMGITPMAADVSSIVTVNGYVVPFGGSSEPILLANARTPIDITVTAGDGSNSKSYMLTANRIAPDVQTMALFGGSVDITDLWIVISNLLNKALANNIEIVLK